MSDIPKSPSAFPEAWRPSSLKEILNRVYEPPPWILDDLLASASGLLCSGHPHAGKSLLWLEAALESVIHHTVWGKFDASKVNRVLFVETEDPRWLVEDRVRGLAQGLGLSAKQDLSELGFGLACTGPFNLVSSQIQLERLIMDWQADWCVLSTLQGLLGARDWKEQKDMGEVNAALVRLQRKCPLVLITHSPHDVGLRRAAGTITQSANFLTLMHFEKKANLVHVTGDSKMGAELDFNLIMQVDTISDGEKERTQVRHICYEHTSVTKEAMILARVKEHPGATAEAIALLCGCSPQYVRKTLNKRKKDED